MNTPKEIVICGMRAKVLEIVKCGHDECTEESYKIIDPEGEEDVVHASECDKIIY